MKLITAKMLLRYAKQYMDLTGLRIVQDDSWYYMTDYKAIAVMKEADDEEREFNKQFVEYIKDKFDFDLPLKYISIFSLFHELGHFVNGWICEPEEYHLLVDEAEDFYEYRAIPDEREADLFAYQFISEHYDKLIEIYTKEETI